MPFSRKTNPHYDATNTMLGSICRLESLKSAICFLSDHKISSKKHFACHLWAGLKFSQVWISYFKCRQLLLGWQPFSGASSLWLTWVLGVSGLLIIMVTIFLPALLPIFSHISNKKNWYWLKSGFWKINNRQKKISAGTKDEVWGLFLYIHKYSLCN